MHAALIYPHQLFPEHPAVEDADVCVLVEEPLMFTQYRFHAKKLLLHRAAMRSFAKRLKERGSEIHYIEAKELATTGDIAEKLKKLGVTHTSVVDPCDDWLLKRLTTGLKHAEIALTVLDDPHFLTPLKVFSEFASENDNLFFTEFYVQQRKRLNILLDSDEKPLGGKWSYDPENRKKLPRGLELPTLEWPEPDSAVTSACRYVDKNFPEAIGEPQGFYYPTTPEQAESCLDDFLEHRFSQFGDYEDAIHKENAFLFHSVLTPALNCGLISPQRVVDKTLEYAEDVPLNSLEGFIRQVIGWREYMRGVYIHYGSEQRTTNFWEHRHPLPDAFYDATTGIEPVDNVIRRVLKHAYCHHIERLMILGNFMLLCEIDPDEVYRWFMELFIDAYDWVMVPNVYGMSQYTDGGLITTKPYISGSNYVLKMSNFSKGPWCKIWKGLYWRFIHRHRMFFKGNPRMAVMVSQADRMGNRLKEHIQVAEQYLQQLH